MRGDACKAVAMIERIVSNACDTITNCYTCKAGTTIERIISNACYTIGNFNACKAGATTERIASNAYNTIGNNGVLATYDKRVACSFYNGITTLAAVIYTVICCNCYALKTGAITECTVSNACNTITNCYTCKT